MAQRYLPLALALIAFAGTLAISSWRVTHLHPYDVSTAASAPTHSAESPERAATPAIASSPRLISLRAMAVIAPASSATAQAQNLSLLSSSTNSAAASTRS